MFSLESLAFHFAAQARAISHQQEALEQAAQIIETEAKAMIGHYQDGWAPLAESTERQKAQKGYPPNAPLLATGEMRDSIEHNVNGLTAFIGTNDDKMKYHEFGTSKMPPRPVYLMAFEHKKNEVIDAVGQSTVKYLS